METPYQQPPGFFSRFRFVIIIIVVIAVVYFLYKKLSGGGSIIPSITADQTPSPVDGKSETKIGASSLPSGDTTDYGMQFWMYIKDWNYNFGKEKHIIKRKNNNPFISLHPTDNSLNVRVNIFPAMPGGAGTYTCTVENVPLQSWFSVSITVFQRNLDIYINGRLVKSCVLPGIPKLAIGDMLVGSKTQGFSGSVCNLHYYTKMLSPSDALSFFNSGTSCGVNTADSSTPPSPGRSITLFGYTFNFTIRDTKGETVSSFQF